VQVVEVIEPAPRILRDARQEAVLKTIRQLGLTPRSAALSNSVPTSTFYLWMQDPAFAEKVDFAESMFERSLAAVVVSAAVKLRSHRAALAFLARRFPDRWTARVDLRVEAHVPDEQEIEERLSPEFREQRMQELVDVWLKERGERREAAS
jgi:hypothetical protein